MPLLIRKINRNKWPEDDTVLANIPADAITGHCMKTKNNTFSVWEVADEDDVHEAVLAIASNGQHLESLDVVQLDLEYLRCNGIDYDQNKGVTRVKDLANTHGDLLDLTYEKIGTIAHHIADRIREERFERYEKGRIKELLRNAIAEERLEASDLEESIREKLEIS